MKKHNFKQKLLQSLKKRDIPRFVCFTDTETHSEVDELIELQKFTLGWIFLWDSNKGMVRDFVDEKFFNSSDEYCRCFETFVKANKKIFIYGHNIFFDLQCAGFFKYFTDAGWCCDWLYDKGLTYILRITYEKLSITCISSTNYYDCSIKELGKMIGLEKKEISLEKATLRQLKNYCYRDTEIVLRGIWYYIEFIQKHDIGRMGVTKASQGFIAFRTRFMNKKIYIHEETEAFELERKSYMGGRVEAFRIGKIPGDDFVMLDVNGMYPFVMKKYWYPSKLVSLMSDEPFSKYERVLQGYGMIAEVELDTPEPVFGVRYKGKLIFPTGNFVAFLCTESLKYALNKGYIKNFVRASVYIMEDLFTEYVDYFQNLRLQYASGNNKIMVKLSKYLLNAFYGKWGQQNIITDMRDNDTDIEYLRREIFDSINMTTWTETYFMNKIMMQHYEGESDHSFPAITAHITDNARLTLWGIIKRIGIERCLYCDTDSVIINREDISRVNDLLDECELGGLKIQDSFSSLIIGGAKNYRCDDKRKIKGIPANAEEIAPGVFSYQSFQRQVSCMRAGQVVGVKVSPVTRSLKHAYDKGVVTASGLVVPYHYRFLEPPF